jgi:hypothetical protein
MSNTNTKTAAKTAAVTAPSDLPWITIREDRFWGNVPEPARDSREDGFIYNGEKPVARYMVRFSLGRGYSQDNLEITLKTEPNWNQGAGYRSTATPEAVQSRARMLARLERVRWLTLQNVDRIQKLCNAQWDLMSNRLKSNGIKSYELAESHNVLELADRDGGRMSLTYNSGNTRRLIIAADKDGLLKTLGELYVDYELEAIYAYYVKLEKYCRGRATRAYLIEEFMKRLLYFQHDKDHFSGLAVRRFAAEDRAVGARITYTINGRQYKRFGNWPMPSDMSTDIDAIAAGKGKTDHVYDGHPEA